MTIIVIQPLLLYYLRQLKGGYVNNTAVCANGKRRARDRLEEMRHASEKNMGERTDKSARGGREWAQDR